MNTVKQRILVVDDDDFVLDMYAIKFQEEGFNLEFARDGHEAMEKIGRGAYAAILTDVSMPRVNGYEFLTALKEKGKKTAPVLVLTNIEESEGKEKCLSLGAADYLIKAFHTPEEVVERVKNIIATS